MFVKRSADEVAVYMKVNQSFRGVAVVQSFICKDIFQNFLVFPFSSIFRDLCCLST